jgi:hypothetical protein
MLLVKNEELRKFFTKDRDRLKKIMITVHSETKGIQYEAFLLLSLFILMPDKEEKVHQILNNNRQKLNDFIKDF